MASVDTQPREGATPDRDVQDVVIRTERLSKTYAGSVTDFGRGRQAPALLDLNMEVLRGEVFAMIGPNGSGKTTTLKLLMGLIFPSTGRAEVLGRNPRTDTNIKRRIGFMPDGPYFYGHLNGFELLDFYANLLGMPSDVRKRRVPQLLDLVGMTNRASRRVRTYSKGMVQRIGLAHALLNDPEIVFLDEPTSGLDPIGARDIRDVVVQMKKDGKTVFLCSHFLTEIENLCDRVILLDRGRTLEYGSLEDLLVQHGMIRVTVSGLPVEQQGAFEQFGEVHRSPDNRDSFEVVVADGPKVLAAIQAVNAAGGHLDGVAPMRRTLEEVFMHAIERTQADEPLQDAGRSRVTLPADDEAATASEPDAGEEGEA